MRQRPLPTILTWPTLAALRAGSHACLSRKQRDRGAIDLRDQAQRENRLMGEARDDLWHAAQRSANELKESVQHGAEELKSAIAPALHPST